MAFYPRPSQGSVLLAAIVTYTKNRVKAKTGKNSALKETVYE
jgi:hypothetical protein